ncbi:large ribosomal subunit protein mL50-like [Artemia franciscana]|uniref:Large ribosomal subunit protein mL50 n=1 Tax=Artemia franciscana TaxID=6661 RepID=A0AA88IA87_ARTSF|nr:hypothetical protein QYM36_001874 [Artemia franciscana]
MACRKVLVPNFFVPRRYISSQIKLERKKAKLEQEETARLNARRKFENDVVSILAKGYLRPSKPYEPKPGVQEKVAELSSKFVTTDFSDTSFKAKFLSLCASEFLHEVPNSLLHQMKSLDDVIDFYNTPVDPRIPLERMKDMELPPNLHIKQDYVTFDQQSDTMFQGLDAFPNRSRIVASLASRKKGMQHIKKEPVYPWPLE